MEAVAGIIRTRVGIITIMYAGPIHIAVRSSPSVRFTDAARLEFEASAALGARSVFSGLV